MHIHVRKKYVTKCRQDNLPSTILTNQLRRLIKGIPPVNEYSVLSALTGKAIGDLYIGLGMTKCSRYIISTESVNVFNRNKKEQLLFCYVFG